MVFGVVVVAVIVVAVVVVGSEELLRIIFHSYFILTLGVIIDHNISRPAGPLTRTRL